jgi:hypothetical protein
MVNIVIQNKGSQFHDFNENNDFPCSWKWREIHMTLGFFVYFFYFWKRNKHVMYTFNYQLYIVLTPITHILSSFSMINTFYPCTFVNATSRGCHFMLKQSPTTEDIVGHMPLISFITNQSNLMIIKFVALNYDTCRILC